MSHFDRFIAPGYAPWDKDDNDLPFCDCCGEDVCIGLNNSVYYAEKDAYYCDGTCLVRAVADNSVYDEVEYEEDVVEYLGGEWV